MGENKKVKAVVVLTLEVEMDWAEGEFDDLQLNAFEFEISNPKIHTVTDLSVDEVQIVGEVG